LISPVIETVADDVKWSTRWGIAVGCSYFKKSTTNYDIGNSTASQTFSFNPYAL